MLKLTDGISGMTESQLKDLFASLGEPSYRAEQLRYWVYRGLAGSFMEMTDLPLALRWKLEEEWRFCSLKVVDEVRGRYGTVKTAFELADGLIVEAVLMTQPRSGGGWRYSVCVSTQVGCAIGCPFCATGQQGFSRNLTTGEIVDQVLYFARWLQQRDGNRQPGSLAGRLSNVVFMGMGEPLANYDNLLAAIRILNSPDGFGLGARSMTISTAGLVPQIECLAGEGIQVGLAVSLHASDDRLRNTLVPLNRKYPLERLLAACRHYFEVTGRRVSFEYALFHGINDSLDQARSLAKLLKGFACHINVIPANPTANREFRPPSRQDVINFTRELQNLGVNVTVRRSCGKDIDAGCGQLSGKLRRLTRGCEVGSGVREKSR